MTLRLGILPTSLSYILTTSNYASRARSDIQLDMTGVLGKVRNHLKFFYYRLSLVSMITLYQRKIRSHPPPPRPPSSNKMGNPTLQPAENEILESQTKRSKMSGKKISTCDFKRRGSVSTLSTSKRIFWGGERLPSIYEPKYRKWIFQLIILGNESSPWIFNDNITI